MPLLLSELALDSVCDLTMSKIWGIACGLLAEEPTDRLRRSVHPVPRLPSHLGAGWSRFLFGANPGIRCKFSQYGVPWYQASSIHPRGPSNVPSIRGPIGQPADVGIATGLRVFTSQWGCGSLHCCQRASAPTEQTDRIQPPVGSSARSSTHMSNGTHS